MTDERDSGQEESFESMLNQSFKKGKRLSPGEKVDAKVVIIGSESIFLDVGSRADGVLPRMEVEKDGELQVAVGDTISVYFKGLREGSMMFTRRFGSGGAEDRKDGNEAVIRMLRDAYEGGVPVEGTVKEVVKGGFVVTMMGQRTFCPISQIGKAFCDDPSVHVNQTYGFIITEFGEEGRNLVISRRRLLEREAEENAALLWESVTEGAVFEGTVTSLQKYGAFVDIGGIEGLVHVSEISHLRVADPKDVLSVGQKVEVSVISADRAGGKISLSIKSLSEDPWVETAGRFMTGQVLQGKVTKLAQFGAFVELAPGIEGLVHISRLGFGERVQNVRDVVKPGEDIMVEVLEVDYTRRRISLARHDKDADDERKELEEYKAQRWAEEKKSMGTFGDLLAKKAKK